MKNVEAVISRIWDAEDELCNRAYMDGLRLGEYWAEVEAGVVELYQGCPDYQSVREARNNPKNGNQTMALEFPREHIRKQGSIGLVISRHCIRYSDKALLDFEQGFIDAVRETFKEVEGELEMRLFKYMGDCEIQEEAEAENVA